MYKWLCTRVSIYIYKWIPRYLDKCEWIKKWQKSEIFSKINKWQLRRGKLYPTAKRTERRCEQWRRPTTSDDIRRHPTTSDLWAVHPADPATSLHQLLHPDQAKWRCKYPGFGVNVKESSSKASNGVSNFPFYGFKNWNIVIGKDIWTKFKIIKFSINKHSNSKIKEMGIVKKLIWRKKL